VVGMRGLRNEVDRLKAKRPPKPREVPAWERRALERLADEEGVDVERVQGLTGTDRRKSGRFTKLCDIERTLDVAQRTGDRLLAELVARYEIGRGSLRAIRDREEELEPTDWIAYVDPNSTPEEITIPADAAHLLKGAEPITDEGEAQLRATEILGEIDAWAEEAHRRLYG
jgi:hypothetical protein